MHVSYKTSSEILNAKFISKGQEIWEINWKLESEHVQEEFGYEIQEIKKELFRLAKLIEPRTEAKVVHPQEFLPSLTQSFRRFGQHPNARPSIPIASNEDCRPNLRHLLDTPKIASVHMKASLYSNQSSSSENNQKDQKLVQIESDRT